MGSILQWLVGGSGPQLRFGRVALVVPSLRHFEAWSALRQVSRNHLEPFEPTWPSDELSMRAYRRRLRRGRRERRYGTGAAFFVLRASDDALVGGVTLSSVRRGVTQSGSIGYWIGLPFVRHGYATEGVAAVLKYAFDELELNRVEAACMPHNRASIAVLEKSGFRREGLARRYLQINGAFQDHLLFARLRDDVPVWRDVAKAELIVARPSERLMGDTAIPVALGDRHVTGATGPGAPSAEGHAV